MLIQVVFIGGIGVYVQATEARQTDLLLLQQLSQSFWHPILRG